MTDIERALADIAEVRQRLAVTQRFHGYSAVAAASSGAFAMAAGVVQLLVVPLPHTAHQGHVYFAIWFVCCALAVTVNYGAIAHWFVNDATARERWQTATVGLSILPALVFGAMLSIALLRADLFAFLPGVWYGCYGVGLFASRATLPRGAVPLAAAFMLAGFGLLLTPADVALAWWVLPLGFGFGQCAIGWFVWRERRVRS